MSSTQPEIKSLRQKTQDILTSDAKNNGIDKNKKVPPFQQMTSDPFMRGKYPHNFNSLEIAQTLTMGDTFSGNVPNSLVPLLYKPSSETSETTAKVFGYESSFSYGIKSLWLSYVITPTLKTFVGTSKKENNFIRAGLHGTVNLLNFLFKTTEYSIRAALSAPLTFLHRLTVGLASQPSDYDDKVKKDEEVFVNNRMVKKTITTRERGTARTLYDQSTSPEVRLIVYLQTLLFGDAAQKEEARKKFANKTLQGSDAPEIPRVFRYTFGIFLQFINAPLNILIKKPIDTLAHFMHYSHMIVNDGIAAIAAKINGNQEEFAERMKRVKVGLVNIAPTAIALAALIPTMILVPGLGTEISGFFTAAGSGSLMGILTTLAAIAVVGLGSFMLQASTAWACEKAELNPTEEETDQMMKDNNMISQSDFFDLSKGRKQGKYEKSLDNAKKIAVRNPNKDAEKSLTIPDNLKDDYEKKRDAFQGKIHKIKTATTQEELAQLEKECEKLSKEFFELAEQIYQSRTAKDEKPKPISVIPKPETASEIYASRIAALNKASSELADLKGAQKESIDNLKKACDEALNVWQALTTNPPELEIATDKSILSEGKESVPLVSAHTKDYDKEKIKAAEDNLENAITAYETGIATIKSQEEIDEPEKIKKPNVAPTTPSSGKNSSSFFKNTEQGIELTTLNSKEKQEEQEQEKLLTGTTTPQRPLVTPTGQLI